MKCEDCIHYDVCKDHRVCEHYSHSARWLHSPYSIGMVVFEVRKKTREQTTYINGKRYRYDDYEWVIEKYVWDWTAVICFSETKMSRIFSNIEDARKCRDMLNEELKEEENNNDKNL